jgi:flagellar motor switch protein FliN/FliY
MAEEAPPPADNPAPQPATPEAQAATPQPAPAPAPPKAGEASAAAPAPEDAALTQESIDALLKQASFDGPEGGAGAAAASADGGGGQDPSIDQLLAQANFEDGTAVASEMPGSDAESFKLPSFQQVMADAQVSSIDLLRDVELNVKIELGRSRMLVEEVLKLGEGSVVELDKLAGDPVDVFVNDRLVARGEVLVLNDSFCVRVNEIVPGVKEEAV